MNDIFKEVACTEENQSLWEKCIKREEELYKKSKDVRSPFARDFTRILHSYSYRRLKHKTQVFFDINNEHVCTRMEHVSHVESVSSTIAKALGLNVELTKAISIGHDLGHAPFGHQGESVLNELSMKYIGTKFWHERNGLRFVDYLELLIDPYDEYKNLLLTYAVRDGIIAHCGEVDVNGIKPRQEFIDLEKDFTEPGLYSPITWEGCVVKIADKIAYIGRDIEDAILLSFLQDAEKKILQNFARKYDRNAINTTIIMNILIADICENSSIEKGICLGEDTYHLLTDLKNFNYKYIYNHSWLNPYKEYSKLLLTTIFNVLFELYDGKNTWEKLNSDNVNSNTLPGAFAEWLSYYCDIDIVPNGKLKQLALSRSNYKIYGKLENEKIYAQAIIDYISGMTDRFAIQIFNELISYE